MKVYFFGDNTIMKVCRGNCFASFQFQAKEYSNLGKILMNNLQNLWKIYRTCTVYSRATLFGKLLSAFAICMVYIIQWAE